MGEAECPCLRFFLPIKLQTAPPRDLISERVIVAHGVSRSDCRRRIQVTSLRCLLWRNRDGFSRLVSASSLNCYSPVASSSLILSSRLPTKSSVFLISVPCAYPPVVGICQNTALDHPVRSVLPFPSVETDERT
jgi:hypothetical protein